MKLMIHLILIWGISSSLSAKNINDSDIVIINLIPEDIGLHFETEEAAWQQRALFSKNMAEGIEYIGKHAKFLLLDMYFPKYRSEDGDDLIIRAIKSSNKIALAAGGFQDGRRERTHAKYLASVKEAGYIGFYDGSPEGHESPDGRGYFQFNGYFCSNGYIKYIYITKCGKSKQERHISLIAVEGFTGKEMRPHIETSIWIPKGLFRRFNILTYKQFVADRTVVHDKLVIFQRRATPTTDIYPLGDGTTITGTEILANLILFFANDHKSP